MRFGRACLEYRVGAHDYRVAGELPLTAEHIRVEGFVRRAGPDGGESQWPPGSPADAADSVELGLRVARVERGVELRRLRFDLLDLDLRDRFLANGFQSWSETRSLGPNDRLAGLRWLGFLKPYGDYGWVKYDGLPGRFHSHWLTYTSDSRGFTFLGSWNDAGAYTVFHVDYRSGCSWVEVDVEGMEPQPGDTLARIFYGEGSDLRELVRAFTARLGDGVPGAGPALAQRPKAGPATAAPAGSRRPGGWNSWYNYYNHVTEENVLAELRTLRGVQLDYLQIDDGWQAEVGDWLDLSPGFRDMKRLAGAIQDRGLTPGIWIAPFVCSRRSRPFKQGWVIKGRNRGRGSRPLSAGWNAGWRSTVYPLDLSQTPARDHIRRVGDAFREWGFGFIKADFLYAAALIPWGGKTRAQRMREAMQALRSEMPGHLLACGVPLASAQGLCDFARLGGDTTQFWEYNLLAFCRYRERASSFNGLRTVLNRWFMNGTLFGLDPDVFFFGKGNLSGRERETLYRVTTTLGSIQFFSDSLGRLDETARDLIRGTFPLPPIKVERVSERGDLYAVSFLKNGEPWILRVNLSGERRGDLEPHGSALEHGLDQAGALR